MGYSKFASSCIPCYSWKPSCMVRLAAVVSKGSIQGSCPTPAPVWLTTSGTALNFRCLPSLPSCVTPISTTSSKQSLLASSRGTRASMEANLRCAPAMSCLSSSSLGKLLADVRFHHADSEEDSCEVGSPADFSLCGDNYREYTKTVV